jgi:hypothetical protein
MMALLLGKPPYSRKKKTDNNIFCPGCDEQNEERMTEDLNMVQQMSKKVEGAVFFS